MSICSNTALLEKASVPTQQRLPPKQYHPMIRRLRYGLFTVYQRLFTVVLVLNVAVVFIWLHFSSWNTAEALQLSTLATFASSNFLLAILLRQDWLINLLFRTAWLVPWSLPLRVRRILSRVYCYGGIHSGAAAAGTLWWIVFTALLSWEGITLGNHTPLLLVLTLVVASLLVTIILLSLPSIRERHHNTWELTHRFLGWTCILLFWAQLLLLTSHTSSLHSQQSFTTALAHTPTFWCLVAITALLAYPWCLLRCWTFTATPLSAHALQLSFPNQVHKYSCLVLSDAPLREWHPFATFPAPGPGVGEMGNSLVVSAAGDWTRALIARALQRGNDVGLNGERALSTVAKDRRNHSSTMDPRPLQMHLYVKPHPRAGVLSLSCVYSRIVILTTGSGIGPSLSSLLDRPAAQTARLVWSTRSPLQTYGPHILRLVDKADPDAVVLDTDQMGRPDLLDVAWRVYCEVRAEAVFVLSNEMVTRRVVGGLERRGVPAFGPIWDS